MSLISQTAAYTCGFFAVLVFLVLALHSFDQWVDRRLEDDHRKNGTKPRKRKLP